MSTSALEFHEKFLDLIKETFLYNNSILTINFIYVSEDTGKTEIRCMFYDVEIPTDFLSQLERRIGNTSVEYDTIRATNKKIMIKDQRDMYGAIIQHVTEYQEKGSAMNIYLTNEESLF